MIEILNADLKLIAVLENATNLNYEKKINSVWNASFGLPYNDTKNDSCNVMSFVRIKDGKNDIGLYRIISKELHKNSTGVVTYQCEHVLATLIDDVLYGYHQLGNIGVFTTEILQYVINAQTVKRWKLGKCDFARQFEYKWENENLLGALFSIPNAFADEYIFTFDTDSYPWTINLLRLDKSKNPDCYIRYEKNLNTITKRLHGLDLCTKLYCLGYGEGVNQLNIKSVNNGAPYLLASPEAIAKFGVITKTFVDRRFEDPQSLKERGQAILTAASKEYVEYAIEAVDLFGITGERADKFEVGDIVRCIDSEIKEDVKTVITSVSKSDVFGRPGEIKLTIANTPQDLAGSIAELADRQRIETVYAQGATNQLMTNYADNADQTHPASLDLYIPDTMVRINKCVLNFRIEAFRAYEKGVSGGGGTTISQQNTTSSAANTSITTGPSSMRTSNQNTNVTTGPSSMKTSDQNNTTTTGASTKSSTQVSMWSYGSQSSHDRVTDIQDDHNHGISSGYSLVKLDSNKKVIDSQVFVASGRHGHALDSGHMHNIEHTHDYYHTHGMNHTHDFAHAHDIDHTHNFQHQHDIIHSHTITDHVHAMQYGIFEGSTASSVTIKVDGKVIPEKTGDIDITKYLSVDGSGKIQRNTWHKIEIVPNALTRITANVFMQIFTNSRGGGDF